VGWGGVGWGGVGWGVPQVVEVLADGFMSVAAPVGGSSPGLRLEEGEPRLGIYRVVLQPLHGLGLCILPLMQLVQPAKSPRFSEFISGFGIA
jgi:hypothetical protein